MTKTMRTARVGADGVLHVPLGAHEANQQVRITIESAGPHMSQEDWQNWVLSVAGSITDPTFRRHEQGDYEAREQFP